MHRSAAVKRTSAVFAALGLVLILALLIPLANLSAATYYKTLTTFTRSGGYTTISISSASATMTENCSWITVSRSSTYVYKISVSANTGDYRSETNVVKLVDGSNTTYYTVKQDAGRFLVTFNANGGTGGPGSQYKTYGASITISGTLPTRSGYTFLGWSASSTATSPTYYAGGTYSDLSSSSLYAVWQRNTCLVTLHANGGTLNSYGTGTHSYYVYQYDTTILSETASRTGFTFLGWSTSSTATSPSYSASNYTYVSISSGTTFYAVWQRNTYTLTFNAVGGTCSESSRPVQYAYAFGALPTPTRSGYTFLGWFTASSGGTQVSSATTMGAASRTIYAQWSRNTCTVTLSANGTGALLDYFNTSTYSYSVYQNDNTTLTTTASRTGFAFLGWSKSSTATSATYTPNPNIQIPITASTTFYAVWQRNNYTLTFNAVGGTCSESSRTVAYQAAFGTLPTPLRSGYTFNGWYTASSGGTKVSSATTMGAASQTIYAQWTRNTCTVTLNANGSGALLDGFNTGTYSYSAYQNDTITLTATASRPGYSFLGWSTTSTATTATYTPNPNIQIPVTANMTFYAVWACTVRLDANADDAKLDYFNTRTHAYSVTPNSTITLTATANRPGYNFLGWSTSSTATTATYTPNPNIQIPITGNTTFYAVWECTVKLDANADDAKLDYFNTRTYTYSVTPNSMITLTATASRPGYSFLGWSKSQTATTAAYTPNPNIQIPITSNTTFYAVWAKQYTLSFNVMGGECSETSRFVTPGYAYGTLPIPTKSGYHFMGWYTTSNGGTIVTATAMMAETDVEIYALWGYRVTFDANKKGEAILDDFHTEKYSFNVLPNSTITITATASRPGYAFVCWSTIQTAISTPCYTPNSYIQIPITKDTDFYAIWTDQVITYQAYVYGEGEITTDHFTEHFFIGDPVRITSKIPSSIIGPVDRGEGYEFRGWTTNNDKTVFVNQEVPDEYIEYTAGEVLILPESHSITLYAVWKLDTSEWTFDDYLDDFFRLNYVSDEKKEEVKIILQNMNEPYKTLYQQALKDYRNMPIEGNSYRDVLLYIFGGGGEMGGKYVRWGQQKDIGVLFHEWGHMVDIYTSGADVWSHTSAEGNLMGVIRGDVETVIRQKITEKYDELYLLDPETVGSNNRETTIENIFFCFMNGQWTSDKGNLSIFEREIFMTVLTDLDAAISNGAVNVCYGIVTGSCVGDRDVYDTDDAMMTEFFANVMCHNGMNSQQDIEEMKAFLGGSYAAVEDTISLIYEGLH